MPNIKIKPLDTIFFKDGKPFSMGEETWANGIFPPNPSVITGVLRTIYMTNNNVAKERVLDETNNLNIVGVAIENDSPLFPLPMDIVTCQGRNGEENLISLKLKDSPALSNYPLPNILSLDVKEKVEEATGFISIAELERYLKKGEVVKYIRQDEIVQSESKIGIGRDRLTHITNESMLYRVNMLRLEDKFRVGDRHRPENDLCFSVNFSGLDSLPDQGICSIGAEGKKAFFQVRDDNILNNIFLPEIENNLLKLYFATPAIFKKGWLPKWMDEGKWKTSSGDTIILKLKACVLGKKVSIGGFDMKHRIPKPMYQAVPAGSVYYIETENVGQAQLLARELHQSRLSEIMPEAGYGWAFVGNVNV